MRRKAVLRDQVVPIALTLVTAAVLAGILWLEILLLNHVLDAGISLRLRWYDILIGGTIYLKTAIDFAIFIGRLMERHPGWKSRVAIEIGTAAGNAAGTLVILLVWALFKEVEWLLALMIFIAALVLFRLAEDGFEHVRFGPGYPRWLVRFADVLEKGTKRLNRLFSPVLRYVIPSLKPTERENVGFWGLFGFSFTVPFILGLDDFAGYVPLFNVVNVFGFAMGVFLGHMILNALLYISPSRTVAAVKHPFISLLGSIAFIGLAIWGIVEVIRIVFHLH